MWVTTATDSDYTLVFWCCLLLKNDRGNDIHHQKMHCAATKQNDSNNNNYNDDDNIDHERDDQRQPRPSAALGKKLNDDLRWRQRWRQQSGRQTSTIHMQLWFPRKMRKLSKMENKFGRFSNTAECRDHFKYCSQPMKYF